MTTEKLLLNLIPAHVGTGLSRIPPDSYPILRQFVRQHRRKTLIELIVRKCVEWIDQDCPDSRTPGDARFQKRVDHRKEETLGLA
ncbi:MAG: hypothetical protein BWY82_01981 [Verrucomicrobia bacterium ADurb.Bin474]|nr:MAG: hypothetical protein BWY82_01981 [Verrucomicrobia bacterium ADurb.Bin474]